MTIERLFLFSFYYYLVRCQDVKLLFITATIELVDGSIRITLQHYYEMMRSFARLLITQSGIDVLPSSKQEAAYISLDAFV